MRTTKTISVIEGISGYQVRNNYECIGYAKNMDEAVEMAKKVDNTKDIIIKSWMYNHVVKAGKVW